MLFPPTNSKKSIKIKIFKIAAVTGARIFDAGAPDALTLKTLTLKDYNRR